MAAGACAGDRTRHGVGHRGSSCAVLSGRRRSGTGRYSPSVTVAFAHSGRISLHPRRRFTDVVSRIRRSDQAQRVGEALVDQRLVAGIGNMWLAEALWRGRVSPWSALDDVSDVELSRTLEWARASMLEAVKGQRPPRAVYRRAGRGCPRCGHAVRSRGLGDANRTAYWCPACQPTSAVAEREGFEPSTSGLPPVTP